MKTVITAGLVALALASAAPAAALTDGEQAFVDKMGELGVSASHGHIDTNARDDVAVVRLGYHICASGPDPLVMERNLITAETRHLTAGEDSLSRDTISAMVVAAKEDLCP